jgi:hypothetical protein
MLLEASPDRVVALCHLLSAKPRRIARASVPLLWSAGLRSGIAAFENQHRNCQHSCPAHSLVPNVGCPRNATLPNARSWDWVPRRGRSDAVCPVPALSARRACGIFRRTCGWRRGPIYGRRSRHSARPGIAFDMLGVPRSRREDDKGENEGSRDSGKCSPADRRFPIPIFRHSVLPISWSGLEPVGCRWASSALLQQQLRGPHGPMHSPK